MLMAHMTLLMGVKMTVLYGVAISVLKLSFCVSLDIYASLMLRLMCKRVGGFWILCILYEQWIT